MTATDDLAEKLIGEQRAREFAQEQAAAASSDAIRRAHLNGYGIEVRVLEIATVNLRAFSRGMIAAEVLPDYIAQAREALDRIEESLK